MDFKINLPTEDCTCDARVFYDKYRKQVDSFIQNELEIAKTTNVVVGKKAKSGFEDTSVLSDYGETSILPTVPLSGKSSVFAKRSFKRKVQLPKIKGAKYKGTKKEETESISVSTVTTETHLPKIKATKKWSDELSSESSDFLDEDQQRDTILPWQEEKGKLQFDKKEKVEDELPSSSSEIRQLLGKQKEAKIQQKKPKPRQKEISKIKLKKKVAAKDEFYSNSSDIMKLIDGDTGKEPRLSWEEELGELLLKKEKTEIKLSSSSSDIMQLLDRSKQKESKSRQKKQRKMQIKKKKDAEDETDESDEEKEEVEELFSSSSEISRLKDDKQKESKPLQKATGEIHVKKKKKPKVELSSSSPIDEDILKVTIPRQKVIDDKHLTKKKKSDIIQPSRTLETDDIEFKKRKKAEDELSSSSSEMSEVIDKEKQKLVQKSTEKIQVKAKKKSGVELHSSSSSSSEEIIKPKDKDKQKEIKSRQKVIDEKHLKKRMKLDKHPSKTSETWKPSDIDKQEEIKLLKEERRELQLKKKQKSSDFLTILKTKSKKEGLDDDFITNMLAQAKEGGHEEDLLLYLSNANDDGTLHSLLFTMSEILAKGEFEEFVINLSNKGKEIKRKKMLLKLIEIFKSDQKDDNYMASLIAKAIEKDPEDELLLILTKAVQENNLNSLISNIYQAKKQGQFDDMVDILLKKGKREQTKQLLSIVNSIAHEMGKDDTFIENLLSKAKKSGQLDELLSEFMRAKSKGTLELFVSALANATGEISVNAIASSVKAEEKKMYREHYSSAILEDAFDEDFLNKWFARAKSKKEEQHLLEKLSDVVKSGKHIEFNALTKEKSVEDIDDLFTIFDEVISDEVISDDDNEIATDIKVSKERRQKFVRLKRKPFKKGQKFRKRAASVVEQNLNDTESPLLLQERRKRKSSGIKKHILFRRQYSVTLPDVDYDLVERHKLLSADLTEPEKSDEEEHVYERKVEKKWSRHYRESFLKKIYGGRSIRPAARPATDSTVSTSSSDSRYGTRRHLPKKKTHAVVMEKEKEKKEPSHRKKNIVKYVKKKPLFAEKEEYSDESDISSYEVLLDKKITSLVDISGEERSERGYLVGFRYKDDDETVDWRKKPKKKGSTSSESFFSDEWVSRARRRAILYFNTRKVEDLFHFLGSHLVSDKPEDPISYLIILLGQCIHFRNGAGRPPILFEEYHVESLYCSMDLFNEGFISLDQYRTGMETLFIKEFKHKPRTNRKNMVLKETFIFEALKRQRMQLRNILRGTSAIFNTKENSSTTLGSVWSKIDLYHEE